MNQQKTPEVFNEFLKSLRVALTNTSVYFKEHPLYIKAINDLKVAVDKVFPQFNPIIIGVTQRALMFAGEYLPDTQLTESLTEFSICVKLRVCILLWELIVMSYRFFLPQRVFLRER